MAIVKDTELTADLLRKYINILPTPGNILQIFFVPELAELLNGEILNRVIPIANSLLCKHCEIFWDHEPRSQEAECSGFRTYSMRRDGMTPLPTGVATLDVGKKLTLKNIFLNKANCAPRKPQLQSSNR